jgi:hypothetical protein
MLSYFVSKIGRSQNSQDVQLLTFPEISSPVEYKSQAFNFFSDAVEHHIITMPFTELSPFFMSNVPVSSGSALQETLGIGTALRTAFRTVTNFSDHAFLDSDGNIIPIHSHHLVDPAQRPAGITTYRFRVSIRPSEFHEALAESPMQTLVFSLALPQTQLSPTNPDPTSRVLFNDPTHVITLSSLQNDFSTVGLKTGTDTLANYSPEVLPRLSNSKLSNLGKRSRAIRIAADEVGPELAPPPVETISPIMRGIIRSAANAVITTYAGPFAFIDNQEAFNHLFPDMQPILPGENTPDLPTTTTLTSFIDLSCNRTLLHILRLDYVGTLATDSAMSTFQTTNAIRVFRMLSYDQVLKKPVTLSPDQLYEAYVSLVPMLPDDVSSWGLTLAHQYHSALTDEVKQRLARDKEFRLPDPAVLPTRASQVSALRTLRSAASLVHRELADEIRTTNRLIQATLQRSPPRTNVTTVPPPEAPPVAPPAAPLRPPAFVSPAEETMRRYSPNSSPTANPIFAVDPVTGYVCSYPSDFRGCLGCGNPDHTFRQCPDKADPATKNKFFRELFSMKPNLRKHPPNAAELAIGISQQQQRNASSLATQATILATANPPAALPPLPSPAAAVDTAPHLFTATVSAFHERSESRPPMPVAIDNGLPHIRIHLGGEPDPSGLQCLDCLLDTCAALNTGYDKYHHWFASQHPECVAELIHCDNPQQPFEALRLLGAVADSVADCNSLNMHGHLTSVIRYYCPYKQPGNDAKPVILSFALGPDVSTNSIIGLPTIDSFGLKIDLLTNRAYSSVCDFTFDIRRACVSHGLPAGISFDLEHFRRMSSQANTSANRPFGSGGVRVNDTFHRGCLNRTLTYLPPDSVSTPAALGSL